MSTESIAVTVVAGLIGLAGLITSSFWVYVANKTLKNIQQGHNTIAILSHLFIIGLTKATIGTGAIATWTWVFYEDRESPWFFVCYAIANLFVTLEPAQLVLISLNRMNSSNHVYSKWSRQSSILALLLSLTVTIVGTILEWLFSKAAGALLISAVLVVLSVTDVAISMKTHKNIRNRFPNELAKSSKILVLSATAFILQSLLYIVMAICSAVISSRHDLFILCGIIVGQLSTIYNGFIYGLTNQRIQPNYQDVCGTKRKSKLTAVMGETNAAFSDDVL